MKKSKILVFLPHYLPGYKSGGILRTIVNTVEALSTDFDFWIVTTDRDLGDVDPYPDIKINCWLNVDGAMVRYLSPERCSIKFLLELIRETPHDLIHLNSFFDKIFTLKILLARRIGLLSNEFIILSPRGELVDGCLRLKYSKKFLFIYISKLFKIYKNIIWHASSEHELLSFENVMKIDRCNVRIALDLPAKPKFLKLDNELLLTESLRVIFISRITREKNLDYALRVLKNISADIVFDIYGPCEDLRYWNECLELIRELPLNVKANYRGVVSPAMVLNVMGGYDLFFFPSRGENYGHVIAESLAAGTKVLISTNTPWLNLAIDDLGWDVDLKQVDMFSKIIQDFSSEPLDVRLKKRSLVRQAANNRLFNSKLIDDNHNLYENRIY